MKTLLVCFAVILGGCMVEGTETESMYDALEQIQLPVASAFCEQHGEGYSREACTTWHYTDDGLATTCTGCSVLCCTATDGCQSAADSYSRVCVSHAVPRAEPFK